MRAVHRARDGRAGLASHRRVGRAVRARILVHDGKVRQHRSLGAIRVGDLNWDGHARSIGNALIRGGGHGTVLIDGERPVRRQLRGQLIGAQLRIGELRADIRGHRNAGLSHLRPVGSLILTSAVTNDVNSAGSNLRVCPARVVGLDRNRDLCTRKRGIRDGRGELTSVFVDSNGPVTGLVFQRAIREGVAVRFLVVSVAAQADIRHSWLKLYLLLGLAGDRGVVRHLDVIRHLEYGLDLIGCAIGVASRDLRGDLAVVSSILRGGSSDGDRSVILDLHRPPLRDSVRVDLKARRRRSIMTVHGGRDVDGARHRLAWYALHQARSGEVRDLGVIRVNDDEQRNDVLRAVGVGHDDARLRERTRCGVRRSGDRDLVGVRIHGGFPPGVDVAGIQLDLGFDAALIAGLHQISNLVAALFEGHRLRSGGDGAVFAIHTGKDGLLRRAVLRIMELRIVQAPLVARNDVGFAVALGAIGLLKDLTKCIGGNRITQLLDRTRLGHNAKASALLRGQLRALIFRHCVENVAVVVDAQLLLPTRGSGVARTDVLALGVISLRHHTRHGVSISVNMTDLQLLARTNDELFLRYPVNRDRRTVIVLTRPWVK